MYGKKTKIISFLMAFILIFTFAFINPLTVSQSYAVVPAIALTAQGAKIIMGVLASAGIGITAGQALQQVDYEAVAIAISNVIYRALDGAEKMALFALSVVDNVVEVPISLYNSIVNKGKKVLETSEFSQTLLEQGITVKYATLTSSNSSDPVLHLPIYQLTNDVSKGWTGEREVDMREAEPFLVYDGTRSNVNSFGHAECVTTNYFDFSTEDNPIINVTLTSSQNKGCVSLTPSLKGYRFRTSTSSTTDFYTCLFLSNYSATIDSINLYISKDSITSISSSSSRSLLSLNKSANFPNIPFTALKFYYYFVRNADGMVGVQCDVYDGESFVGQYRSFDSAGVRFNSVVTDENLFDMPSGLDATISVEEMPTSVITNSDASANVLTLPSTVADSIGLTSTDVNVGTIDVPETGEGTGTNTETMDNINTNVGELVTGGELGEQVNTNIGTVEGLHGEITEQVDFGAVFDTIAQYISSLDISSVTWFPVAVAGFISPFLPLISLGIILFFIDRVLNGGA